MRTGAWVLSLVFLSLGCEENKYDKILAEKKEAAAPPATVVSAPIPVEAGLPPPVQRKKLADCKFDGPVTFDNPTLEADIRKKLAKDAGAITWGDLANVRSVNVAEGKVDELDPCIFPKLVNLKHLYLGPGELDDLTPIENLIQLEGLRASINKVENLKPLTKLTMLDRLDLGRTAVHDIGPLENLTNLTELQLDDTSVRDLTPLAKCKKLERLSIKNTPVVSVAPLKDLRKLKFLYIAGTAVTDLNALEPLKNGGLKVVTK